MSTTTRFTCLNIALTIAAFCTSIALYGALPEQIPIHWGTSGEPDGFVGKPFGPFVLPMVLMMITFILSAAARMQKAEEARVGFFFLQTCVGLFLLTAHVATLLVAEGRHVPMGAVIQFGLGALFLVIGLVLPKLPPNRLIGVRTRAALSDPDAQRRANLLGRYCFWLGALMFIVSASLKGSILVSGLIAVMLAIAPAVLTHTASPKS